MTPRWRTVLALSLAIAALWWLAFAGSTPDPKPADRTQLPPASTVATAEPRAQPPAAAVPATPVVAQAPTPPPPAQAEAPAAPAVVRPPDTRGFTDVLQQRFESDPADREAGVSESALLQLVADSGASTLVRSVVCHHTVCKLALRWHAEDEPAYQRLLAQLMGDNAKLFATRAEPPDDTGRALVDAYWVRR